MRATCSFCASCCREYAGLENGVRGLDALPVVCKHELGQNEHAVVVPGERVFERKQRRGRARPVRLAVFDERCGQAVQRYFINFNLREVAASPRIIR